MGLIPRKPVYGVSNKASFKPVSSATETSLKLNFTGTKFTYDTFQKANNKGTDQSALMRRLVCVVCKPRRQVFLRCGPNARWYLINTDPTDLSILGTCAHNSLTLSLFFLTSIILLFTKGKDGHSAAAQIVCGWFSPSYSAYKLLCLSFKNKQFYVLSSVVYQNWSTFTVHCHFVFFLIKLGYILSCQPGVTVTYYIVYNC